MPSHLMTASQIAAALNAGTITVSQAGILQIQAAGGNPLTDFVAPPIPSFPTPIDLPLPPTSNINPNSLTQPFFVDPVPPSGSTTRPVVFNASPSGTPISFTPPPLVIPQSPIQPQGVGQMVSRLGFVAAPALVLVFQTAGRVINAGGAMRLGPLTGRGVFATIIGGLGFSQAADIFNNMFNDTSKEQMLGELLEELVDSQYILWDTKDRRGNDRTMEYIILPVGDNAHREQPYGMAYRPFSKSSMFKRDQNQDTYRRPTRARRRTQGGRGSRS